MIYLSGAHHPKGPGAGLGLLVTPDTLYLREHVHRYGIYAIDNACFAGDFNPETFWSLVRFNCTQVRGASFCLFATAPDKVCDAEETFRRGYSMLHHIRYWGTPAAYVAQNGLETQKYHGTHLVQSEIFWDQFDVLFIGGDDEWKEGDAARWLTKQAHKRRKWVHMGRVNTLRRMEIAASFGVDSADGTFLRFGPDINLPKLTRYLWHAHTAPGQLALPAA